MNFEQIVAFLGVLVYKFYGEELREMFGYEEHPYGFYTMAVLAIVLVGLLYGFFIAIICGQRINERHYHVLAKQELTKGSSEIQVLFHYIIYIQLVKVNSQF
ncbi:uncharacterized protein LOC114302392 isoform X1 [Camellia sinensis]|uniref:uncharacterized protein LOC114302392 isoform X1 n=1 Tax=Camellia sinensis TaxID=4442 RepID=UPI0010359B3E|nr:uncharacterized protein LOC114302392 isoform X1 [Camellia sinensis]